MRFDLDHLRVFCAVVEAGSFTAAAELLHISQPSVSRTIDILECRLGFKLFIRTSRGIFITPEGERLSRTATRMIKEIEMEVKLMHDVSSEPQGELKIITTPYMASAWLVNRVKNFLDQYPKLTLDINGTMGPIDPKEGDVVIRTEIPHHPGLIQRHILSVRMGLFASKEYLAKAGTPKSAEELDNHKIISFGDNTTNPYGNHSWVLTVGDTSTHGRVPYMKVNSLDGLFNAAKCSLGIVELSSVWDSVREAKLVQVLPELEAPLVKLYYIYPEKMKNSPRVTALADHLEAEKKASDSE